MAEIAIRNLRKEFGSFTAVQSSSFKVEPDALGNAMTETALVVN